LWEDLRSRGWDEVRLHGCCLERGELVPALFGRFRPGQGHELSVLPREGFRLLQEAYPIVRLMLAGFDFLASPRAADVFEQAGRWRCLLICRAAGRSRYRMEEYASRQEALRRARAFVNGLSLPPASPNRSPA